MNVSHPISSVATQYRWRTTLQPVPRPSTTGNTRYEAMPKAPQGIVSQARETLREANHGSEAARPATTKRRIFGELQVNGRQHLGREDSPSPRRTEALRTIRHYGRETDDTTTNLRMDETTSPFHNSGQSLPRMLEPSVEEPTLRLGLSSNPVRIRKNEPLANDRMVRRPAAVFADRLATVTEGDKTNVSDIGRVRENRRRTVYIPDDTTVMTIHPGGSLESSLGGRAMRRTSLAPKEPREARRRSKALPPSVAFGIGDSTMMLNLPAVTSTSSSFLRSAGGNGNGGNGSKQLPSLAGNQLSKRARRRSSVLAGVTAVHKSVKFARDVSLVPVAEQSSSQDQQHCARKPEHALLPSRTALSNISTNGRMSLKPCATNLGKRGNKEAIQKLLVRRNIRIGSADRMMPSTSPFPQVSKEPQLPRGSATSGLKSSHMRDTRSANPVFAILQDDLAHPELYEDSWLEHQELALTQLLNIFFEGSDLSLSNDQPTQRSLRYQLIQIYNDPEILLLVKRLQASLMYGSLMVPQDILMRSIRLKDDIGQRQKFLRCFTDTYEHTYLQAAAEAIVGRRLICSTNRHSSESAPAGQLSEVATKKDLESFLDAFFIQHHDVNVVSKPGAGSTITAFIKDKTDQIGSPLWAWRRTVTRSLMIVLVLDRAKENGQIAGNLFQKGSSKKSSEMTIKAIASILLPSFGDVMRPLRHMRYDISVSQRSLDEFDYHIENLAIDFRDGIRLAKVIELIVNRSQEHPPAEGVDVSAQLKYPCLSRAHRLQNAKMALEGLECLRGIPEKVLRDVTATDIVDGHREKTLSLLWALLGQYGVKHLVDWDMLKKEISFMHGTPAIDFFNVDHLQSSSEYWQLLFTWAELACANRHVKISNLTTSFADGTAFEAIINKYMLYFPSKSAQTSPSLGATLRAIGCSTAFSSLLSSPRDIIPTKDFTLTSLAFLAARLLPAAKTDRAARVIQRAYRSILWRRNQTRRVALMRLASHCAVVVNAREQVVSAAVVLQRAWRKMLCGRREVLNRDVQVFQSVARGCLVRWKVTSKAGTRHGRPRAGW